MASLPRVGCVFADHERWWWIVPAGSHIDIAWPSVTTYAVGGYLTAPDPDSADRPRYPRLIHHPQDDTPYTPPLPLYFLTCRIAGIKPSWSRGTGRQLVRDRTAQGR